MRRLVLILLLSLAVPHLATALTLYYVDPDYVGATRDGQAATPWQSLSDTHTNTPWTVLNAALAGDDVTVYFSARTASSDTDQASTVGLDLGRTEASTHRLTLDGMSQYNSNDSTPVWSAYSGSAKFTVITAGGSGVSSGNFDAPYPPRNYITVRGFRVHASNQPVVLTNMSHVVFEDNEVTTQGGSGTPAIGPGLIVTHYPDGDSTSANYATDIVIRDNYVHHTYGECVYIGGSIGSPASDATPRNVEAHTNVLITGNTLEHCGTAGAQGDGIDVKDGNTNLRIVGNQITLAWTEYSENRGITIESADLIDSNLIVGSPTHGIVTTSGWNNTYGRQALVIRNNIVLGAYHESMRLLGGDNGETWDWYNTVIVNNTLFKPADSSTDNILDIGGHKQVTFKNNILVGHNTYQCLRLDSAGVFTSSADHDYNLYFNTTSPYNWVVDNGTGYDQGAMATWEAHSVFVDPQFLSELPPYVATQVQLQAGSPALAAGVVLSPTFPDYGGTPRPSTAWDLGAWTQTPTPVPKHRKHKH